MTTIRRRAASPVEIGDACDRPILPSWQTHQLDWHVPWLFGLHLLAATLLVLFVLDTPGLHARLAWSACFLAAWGCAWPLVSCQGLADDARSAPAAHLRMTAVATFVWSSPWVAIPVLLFPEPLANQLVAMCVLTVLAAATSHALIAHLPSAAIGIFSLLLPATILFSWEQGGLHRRVAVCLAALLGMLLFIAFRSARLVSCARRLQLESEHHADQLRNHIRQLEQMHDKTEKALLIAEQACMDKTRFLATASHDLRQPIHAISLFVAALKSEAFDHRTRYLVDRLDRALSGLDNLFNRLLDISRLDGGVVTPSVKVVDAYVVAQILETRFSPVAASKSLQFRVRCRPGLYLRSDPDLLTELLSNLLANAFKYTLHGGVLLSFRRSGGRCLIQVWDTGCGISEKHIGMVFDEFVQLDNPSRDRRRGLGLGLAIVKRIADMLGHELEVRSHPGSGSCFGLRVEYVTSNLPVQYEGMQETERTPALDGALVLVVDDEIDILAAMEALLNSWGCTALLARTPEEAAKHVEASLRFPDLIITDHRLDNHQTSFDVDTAIAPLVPYSIPTIVISGESSAGLERKVQDCGWLFMSKPVNADRLRTAVERAMEMTTEILSKAA